MNLQSMSCIRKCFVAQNSILCRSAKIFCHSANSSLLFKLLLFAFQTPIKWTAKGHCLECKILLFAECLSILCWAGNQHMVRHALTAQYISDPINTVITMSMSVRR